MLKVKVCGIKNLEDALMCEEAGADALGFIFYKKSKRYIEPDSAERIIGCLSPFTMKVGVFVNDSITFVNETARTLKLNAVQLHGEEDPEYLKEINSPVIKTFRINDGFDFSKIEKYTNVSFLFDTFSNSFYGGTGRSFNWKLIPQELRSKIILAGGISSNNIEEIINEVKPAAIDISSSLEIEPGKKNKEKVKEFFNKLNNLKSKAYQFA